ncbi:MAG: acyl-CoA dehydrogenase [Gammaproteobacteria bacterium]
MVTFSTLVVIAAFAWLLLYFRAPLWLWTVLAPAAWGGWVVVSPAFSWAQGVVALLLAAVFIPLTVRPLRRRLSRPVLQAFRVHMPAISRTEQEALRAGTVWWDGNLFRGMPPWNMLLQFPQPQLRSDEQAFLDGPVEQLCAMLDDWDITHERQDLPPAVWHFIKERGFFGMIIPRRYGGLEFSAHAHSCVVMKVASRSVTAAVTLMVPNSLGPAELLLRYGTDAQKDHYLPRLARGDEVPCFALTGPEAGSDAAAIPDTGVVCRQDVHGRRNVLGIRLNWSKRYITLGPVATVLGLAFKLHDPEHLIGDRDALGITLALIPTDTPGIDIGRRHLPLNIPFQNGPNRGKDVFIPMDRVIGGRERVGQGWQMLMECLAAGRSISLPALSTGAGKLASRASGAYARVRQQFKLPIGRFEGVEEALARIGGYTYQMDAVRNLTTTGVDLGEHPAVVSAIAKYNLTERMRRVINDAMDVHGGVGICMGPHNLLARAYQAIPISITVEGANILTRSLIVFGQGALRCHPYALEEISAALDPNPDAALKRFDRALFGHMGFTLSNLARSLFLGLTGARLARSPVRGPAARYYRQLTRMSAVFALVADISMLTLGGALKRREKLSGRLADMFSNLYIGSACLKRFHDQQSPAEDLPLLHWSCQQALYEIQTACTALLRNYPNRWLAWLLRALAFPLGAHCRPPSDQLGHQVAVLLLEPGAVRDRLTQGIFLPQAGREALARLDDALSKVVAAEPVEQTLRNAMRDGRLQDHGDLLEQALQDSVISADEAALVRAARAARTVVTAVDDFVPSLHGNGAAGPESAAPLKSEPIADPAAVQSAAAQPVRGAGQL